MSGGGGASSGGGGGGGLGPEVWKGLLQWSMEYHDGTSAPSLGPMAEEKKKWLEKVMEGTFVDLAKRMRGQLDALDKAFEDRKEKSGKQGEEEEEGVDVEALWEELQEHVENMDYALVFCQVGGLPTLFKYLQTPPQAEAEASLLPALSVLAALTQNNPRVQAEVLAFCAQPKVQIDLLALLGGLVTGTAATGRRSARLRAKALHALSCTVRAPGPTPLEARFVAELGLPLFQSALAKDAEGDIDGRVLGKGLFLLQALLGADHADKARGEALGLPLLPLVVPALAHEEVGVRHAAAAVVSELANRLGGPAALLASPAGPALRAMMAERLAVIGALPAGSVDRAEAAEEEAFWAVVEARGRFLRDGEREGGDEAAAGAAAGGGEGAAVGAAEMGQGDGHAEAPAPMLLLEPPKLSGASQAP